MACTAVGYSSKAVYSSIWPTFATMRFPWREATVYVGASKRVRSRAALIRVGDVHLAPMFAV